jgi:hypothetical protein
MPTAFTSFSSGASMQFDGTVNCIFDNSDDLAIMYAGFVSSMQVNIVNCICGSSKENIAIMHAGTASSGPE